jgi:hypothetical protein
MEFEQILEELKRNKTVFRELLSVLTKNQYLWRPSREKWCLLEIICHLYDEEREDFRARTKHVLENPELPLPPINPVGWVLERKYIEQDFVEKLEGFLIERENSLNWLNSLENSNWDNFYKHPLFGKMTAGMFLANWVAHDYIHIRQIIRLKYAYLEKKSGENITYAGDW